jgi:LysM repeat protein
VRRRSSPSDSTGVGILIVILFACFVCNSARECGDGGGDRGYLPPTSAVLRGAETGVPKRTQVSPNNTLHLRQPSTAGALRRPSPTRPAGAYTATRALPSKSTSSLIYVVRAGDTLAVIAAAYSVSVDAIARANAISDPNRIEVGQLLLMPPGAVQPDPARLAAPRPPTSRPVAPAIAAPTAVRAQPARACCKVCRRGKACGDTCIARDKTCHKEPGCA